MRFPRLTSASLEIGYRPFDRGLYQVAPMLKPLNLFPGTPIPEKQTMESRVFQIDQNWEKYRISKETALQDEKSKYLGFAELDSDAFGAVTWFICNQLTQEYPAEFSLNGSPKAFTLKSQITQESISFKDEVDLEAWTKLSLQIQEDFAIWKMTPDREWLAAISILSPNHWAPQEKLARSFAEVHAPVAGIEPINSRARQMVETMILKGPFQRFAWGMATDTRLNHHPVAPGTHNQTEWQGRGFDRTKPQLYVRTERQCLVPFPAVACSLFTIRTYFEDCESIKKDPQAKAALISALESMSPESRIYKGLKDSYHDILDWLQQN